MRLRTKLSVLVAIAATAPLADAGAQIRFTGFTSGCFGPGCTPTALQATDATGFFRFNSNAFDVETLDGQAALGGSTDNIGLFTFLGATVPANRGNVSFSNQTFRLRFNFTSLSSVPSAPGVPVTPQTIDFTGRVLGGVSTSNGLTRGGPRILFDTPTQEFAFLFNGLQGEGTLNIQNLISVSPNGFVNQTTAADGFITADVTVPEPATVTLLGVGMLALGAAGARTRRQAQA